MTAIDELLKQNEALRRFSELSTSAQLAQSWRKQREMYDAAWGGGALREALERLQEQQRALFQPLAELRWEQSELGRSVAQLKETWSGVGATALMKSFLDMRETVEKMLPASQLRAMSSDWEKAIAALRRPEWTVLAEQLARSNRDATALELLDDFADFAYENRPASEKPQSDSTTGHWRALTIWEWMTILSLLITIAQGVRTEVIAGDAAASEQRIVSTVASAQAILLQEIRQHFAAREEKRWVVQERGVWLTRAAEPGSKRVAQLKPGEILVQIDHQGEWIEVHVVIDGRHLSGWILKKYAKPSS